MPPALVDQRAVGHVLADRALLEVIRAGLTVRHRPICPCGTRDQRASGLCGRCERTHRPAP